MKGLQQRLHGRDHQLVNEAAFHAAAQCTLVMPRAPISCRLTRMNLWSWRCASRIQTVLHRMARAAGFEPYDGSSSMNIENKFVLFIATRIAVEKCMAERIKDEKLLVS